MYLLYVGRVHIPTLHMHVHVIILSQSSFPTQSGLLARFHIIAYPNTNAPPPKSTHDPYMSHCWWSLLIVYGQEGLGCQGMMMMTHQFM